MVDDAATEGQYHSIFGPGGPAPPREASYRESLELGSLMSEIAVYYDAFGYTTAGAEPPDHIAVEAGFIAYLTLKQAYALACENPEHAELAAIGASRFRADHLAYIAEPMAALLAGSNVQYLARAARALATRVGLPPRSSRLPMAQPASSDEDPINCGS
jgi:nitrate reductase assembly molybdenum cofactor insertion protein NarJ